MEQYVPATVPQALGRLRVALDDAYQRAAREVGLTAQQAELLCASLAPTGVGDLAERLRCDRSNVSRLVDRAAARGLVERTTIAADGRVSLIALTPDGSDLAKRFLAKLEAQTADLRARWSDRKQDQATTILNELSDALSAGREQSG